MIDTKSRTYRCTLILMVHSSREAIVRLGDQPERARRILSKRIGPEWTLSATEITADEMPDERDHWGRFKVRVMIAVTAIAAPVNWLRRLEWALSPTAFDRDWPSIMAGRFAEDERKRQASRMSICAAVAHIPWC